MVLRCYSRRHLVPAARALQRSISTAVPAAAAHTPFPTAQNPLSAASARQSQRHAVKDEKQQRHESWSFFFPDHLPWSQRPPASPRARHPLVKKLISEIYSTSRVPAANRVWKAYMDLKEANDAHLASSSSSASSSLLTQLEPSTLQHLLRAIDPAVAKTRSLSRAESKRRQTIQQQQALLATGSSPSKILLVESHVSRHSGKIFDAQHPVREYMRRVQIIFRDMRLHSSTVPTTSSAVQPLPSLADYNHVLSRLASGGHIGPMSSIWNEITGTSPTARSKGLHPNQYTYRELMIGLSRHATEQIERVQKSEASKLLSYSGKRKQLEKEKSARSAAGGLAKFGQVLAPSARAAAILAALRTMALLKDMKDHAVTPNQITLDFAARTLRLAGHIDGLHLLMQQAYGIDLGAPDSAAAVQKQQDGVAPTLHTLNTILMTLGEQASVPEMIAAFETLAKPLPLNTANVNAAASGEGVFSTKWKDIFSSMRNRDAEISQQGSNADESTMPEVFAYSSPQRISPNTKTFEVLLRHCCSEVDPLRSPVALKTEVSTSNVATLAKESTESALADMRGGGLRAVEMERRTKGAYLLFAKSLLSEALDRSDELLRVTAQNLGIVLERSEQSAEATEAQENNPFEGLLNSALQLRPEHLRVSVAPGRAMDADFVPILQPPSFAITATMAEPFISLSSARKSIGELRWIRLILSRALENKAAEARLIDLAWQVYNARYSKMRQLASAQKDGGEPVLNDLQDLAPLQLNDQKPNDVLTFLNRLRKQHRLASKQAQALEQLLYDKVDERIHDLATRRTNRQMQRILNHREERLKADKQRLEEEEREAARKAQAAESRRLRALQKEQQDVAQQASSESAGSHIEVASTVSA